MIMAHQSDSIDTYHFQWFLPISIAQQVCTCVYEYIFVDCNRYDIDDIDSKETKK